MGHAVGRRDPRRRPRAGLDGAALRRDVHVDCGAPCSSFLASLLLEAFTSDAGVLDVGVRLLFVAAVFQLFDGVQGVATGILRGLGDTRTPMLWNLFAHWFVGLPLGYTLCFILGLGVVGLWWGLSLGLIICGSALLLVWSRRIRQFQAQWPDLSADTSRTPDYGVRSGYLFST